MGEDSAISQGSARHAPTRGRDRGRDGGGEQYTERGPSLTFVLDPGAGDLDELHLVDRNWARFARLDFQRKLVLFQGGLGMLSRFCPRLTYANVIATVALFVALGGSSYAALSLPKHSVGSKQLKKNSVTSVKVKPGSLLTSDFKASQRARLRGPQGPQGIQGVQGQPGAPGSARAYAAVEADASIPPTFFSGPHPGFTAVTRTDPGTYCVAAPGLSDAQLKAAHVSVSSPGSPYFVALGACTGGAEVVTRTAAGTEVDNIDFNVMVP